MRTEEERKILNFPRTFWTANVIELFERGAYYAVASFVLISARYLIADLQPDPTFSELC